MKSAMEEELEERLQRCMDENNCALGEYISHGIWLSVVQDCMQPKRECKSQDFQKCVKHQPFLENSLGFCVSYKFVDWCPVVFRNFRSFQKISSESFKESMKNLTTPFEGGGKSGAKFFKSTDNKYIIKELRRDERDTLLEILKDLTNFTRQHPFTLLPKFVGLYTIAGVPKLVDEPMTFVVMKNIIQFDNTEKRISFDTKEKKKRTQFDNKDVEIYDLKGSIHNRFSKKNKVLKDLNLDEKFTIGIERKTVLFKQLEMDVEFLEQRNLMDYSLLVGVKKKNTISKQSKNKNKTLSIDVENINDNHDIGEIGAILKRNSSTRRLYEELLPKGNQIKVNLIGHGMAKRSRESSTIFRQSCTTYTFLVKNKTNNTQWMIFRRYKEFEQFQNGLKQELRQVNSNIKLPALPIKQRIGFMDPQFIKQRENDLNNWLQTILNLTGHKVYSPSLHSFLTLKANKCPTKWKPQDGLDDSIISSRCRAGSCSSIQSEDEDLLLLSNNNSDKVKEIWNTLGMESHQNVVTNDNEKYLCFGIIDILQKYNFSKKLETVFKGLTNNLNGISAIDPERYGERFLNFMDESVFG